MLRMAAIVAVICATVALVWAVPNVASLALHAEHFIPGSVCGTGWKAARQAECNSALISLALAIPCLAGLAVAMPRLTRNQRLLCEVAVILAAAHGLLAYFGPLLASQLGL